MLKLLFAAIIGAAIVLFAPSPAAHARTCTEAYLDCAQACPIGIISSAGVIGTCDAYCNAQRAPCVHTGSFRHFGNQWTGLRRS